MTRNRQVDVRGLALYGHKIGFLLIVYQKGSWKAFKGKIPCLLEWFRNAHDIFGALSVFLSFSNCMTWPVHFIICTLLYLFDYQVWMPINYSNCLNDSLKALSTSWYGVVQFRTTRFWVLFHCVLYLVPGTFFSSFSGEVPSELYHYQNTYTAKKMLL